MTPRDQIAAAVASAFSPDLFGQEVEYNSVPVNAIFNLSATPQNVPHGSKAVAELQVMVVDVPTWAVDDLVYIDGQNWRVKSAGQGSTWYKHVLQIERDRRLKP